MRKLVQVGYFLVNLKIIKRLYEHFSRSLPLNIIDQSSLKQQVPFGKKVVTDQILIGSHCHSITNTEGTQDIQDLK